MDYPTSGHGLILSVERHRAGLADRELARACLRGALVRLRRGAYVASGRWRQLDDRARHLLRARAVQLAAGRRPVFCGVTAAAIWGMPVLERFPGTVHVLAPPGNGGRSKGDVQRHPGSAGQLVEIDGLLVTGLARTAVDIALGAPFQAGVGSVDWALWRRNPHRVTREALIEELERLSPRYGRRRAEAVLQFASELSDSYGESLARAGFELLGYPQPELQVRFSDRQGDMVVDYFWREQGIAGEFDGEVKYQRPEMLKGRTPGEAAWAEKKREDRLRRQCRGVARIIMAEARDLSRLDQVLRDSGLRRESELAA